jgi:hypothetical protein
MRLDAKLKDVKSEMEEAWLDDRMKKETWEVVCSNRDLLPRSPCGFASV